MAGLAALLIQRYDNPNQRKYTAEDVANWLQDTAVQRDFTTDPNHTWGHGFAMLPNPAPTSSFGPAPDSIVVDQTKTYGVGALPSGSNVRAEANYKGDIGNLSFNTVCPGTDKMHTTLTNGDFVTLKGCTAGDATVRIYKADTNVLLKHYDVTVGPSPTLVAPTKVGITVRRYIDVGETTDEIDVYGQFSGTVNSYSASSSDVTKATVAIAGSKMKITGVAAGTETITVTAENNGGTATQTYPVTVEAVQDTSTSFAPSANAGLDQTVSFGATVSLFGTGSPSDDDDDVTYSWVRVSGPVVVLKVANTGGPYRAGLGGNAAKFVAPSSSGILVFRLTVTDTAGRSSSDDVTITVGP